MNAIIYTFKSNLFVSKALVKQCVTIIKKRALTEMERNDCFEKHPHIFTDKCLNTQDQKMLVI